MDEVNYRRKGDKLTRGGYTIQPFEGRFLVYTRIRPLAFFDTINESKKYISKQVRAGVKMDSFMDNLKRQSDAMIRTLNRKVL